MNKKALLLLYLIGLVAAPSHSQSVAEREGTLTITPSFVSGYMSYGVWLGGWSFQPTIEYSKGPLSLELFANFPIADKVPGTSDPEIDFSVSHTWDIMPDIFKVKPGVCLYTYPRANRDDGFYNVTWEPRISFDYTVSKMNFSLDFYYDVTMKGGGWEFAFNRLIPI